MTLPATPFSKSRLARSLVLGVLLFPIVAHAGREILLDLPGSPYTNNGQSWGAYQASTTFSNTLGGVVIGTSEVISNNGEITYTGTPFYFRPLILPSGQTYSLNPNDSFSAIGINIGQVDARVFDPTLTNDPSDPVNFPYNNPYNAARYNYNDVCVGGSCFTFQVIDIRLAAGVDVLEFNYGGAAFPPGATASFSAGPYGLASFTPATGPALCLKNGVQTVFTSIASCSAGAAAVVPEPELPALLAIGIVGLAAGLRKRRSTRSR